MMSESYRQKTFNMDILEHSYIQPDIEDATTSGLLRVWATALANGWLSLAELTRRQVEKLLRPGDGK